MRQQTIMTLPKTQRRAIFTAIILLFLMNAGFFLLIPLLSVHFVDNLGWAAAFVGIVLAVRQFMQQGLTVFGGALADRFGAKQLIVIGLFTRAISFVMIGYATTPTGLLISSVVAALAGSLMGAPIKAMIAAITPEPLLPDVYAKVGISRNIARSVGPMIGALLIGLNFKTVGVAAAGFFLLAFIVALIGLPNINVSTDKQSASKSLSMAFHDRTFLTYTALMMGFWFMWVQISIALPLKAIALTGDISSVSIMLTVNALLAILLQIPALKLANKFLLPLPTLIVGIMSMAIGLGSVAIVNGIWQLYISIFFFALGTVLATPNAQTVAATMANPRARGAYFGVDSLAIAFGGGIGQVMGGSMIDVASNLNFPALPWLVSAAVGTTAAIGLMYFYHHHRREVTPKELLA
ncbi:MAG: MFS transporter [Chloroflexi bacterium]|nr:MAG: MFS transporter [Chloroflexota bacterium]